MSTRVQNLPTRINGEITTNVICSHGVDGVNFGGIYRLFSFFKYYLVGWV